MNIKQLNEEFKKYFEQLEEQQLYRLCIEFDESLEKTLEDILDGLWEEDDDAYIEDMNRPLLCQVIDSYDENHLYNIYDVVKKYNVAHENDEHIFSMTIDELN